MADLAGRIVVRWNPPIADVGGGLLTGLAGYAILRAEVGVTSFVVVDTVDAETREFLDVGLKSRTALPVYCGRF